MNANLYTMPLPTTMLEPKTTLRQVPSIEIHTLQGLFEKQPYATMQRRYLDNKYVLIWCRKGNIQLTAYQKHYQLDCNTVYCLSPAQGYNLQAWEGAEGYYISLPSDFFQQYGYGASHCFFSLHVASLAHPAGIPVDTDMQQNLEQVLVCLQREIMINVALTSEIVSGLIKVLLLYLSRKLAAGIGFSMSRDAWLVKKFLESLEKKFIYMKKVADYASELCVTPGYLTQVVKRVSGFTPSYHIQQAILCEAKRLATFDVRRSMKEIAYALGFEDLAHFSKFFKVNAGANFTSFRRELLVEG